jgi:hypothetical protein
LTSAIKKLPHGGTVIIATDHDTGGKHLADRIKDIVAGTERDDLGIIEHRPDKEGQDWNNVLKDSLALDSTPAVSRHDPPALPRLKP